MFTSYITNNMPDSSRKFTFTGNNYTPEEYAMLVSWKDHKQIRYLIFGEEIGEEKGTPHLQGAIIFYNAKTFEQACKFFKDPEHKRFHIEFMRKDIRNNIAYCSKDEKYIEYGEIPEQGSRKDILRIQEAFRRGERIDRIVMQSTSYQSARHAEILMKYRRPNWERKAPTVYWFWGPTGSGKTRTAIEMAKLNYGDNWVDETWISGRDLQWWQSYFGQKFVILDDFRKDFCKFHELIRILDRYPYNSQVKGSSVWLDAEVIVITSCYHPNEVYQTREDLKQLIRRITEIREFKGTRCLFDEVDNSTAGVWRPQTSVRDDYGASTSTAHLQTQDEEIDEVDD